MIVNTLPRRSHFAAPSVPQMEVISSSSRFAKPSDQAISNLFAKVGGDLDQTLRQTKLDWRNKELGVEDAEVVAYVIACSAVLEELK